MEVALFAGPGDFFFFPPRWHRLAFHRKQNTGGSEPTAK